MARDASRPLPRTASSTARNANPNFAEQPDISRGTPEAPSAPHLDLRPCSPSPSRLLLLGAAGPTPSAEWDEPDSKRHGGVREGEQGASAARLGGGGLECTASGVPREAFQPGDLALPQILAPARAPRPLFSPSGNTPNRTSRDRRGERPRRALVGGRKSRAAGADARKGARGRAAAT